MTAARWRSLASQIRRTPLLLIVQSVVRRIPGALVDVGKLCFLRLDGVPAVPRGMLRGPAAVRAATVADLDALTELQDKRELFRTRFEEGDRAVVALVGGRIVGYEWFSVQASHRESVWGYTIDIPADAVYAYDAYIDRAYRNSGIWIRFKAHLGEWMPGTDRRAVVTYVEYGNEASLRTHLRFGFAPWTSVVAIRVMGRRFFAAPRPPADDRAFRIPDRRSCRPAEAPPAARIS